MKQVCTLIVLACLSWQAYAQISLSGTVTSADNTPLIGAHVILDNQFRTTTAENGRFVFSNLPSGKFKLVISYIGYHNFEEPITLRGDTIVNVIMQEAATLSNAVIVSGIRATENTPATFTTLNREQIERNNNVQDLPYLLDTEPSVVTTSDAGTGIGYTSLRIRGSDITRINVTINGIPLNDPESHAVYWVDIPDFAASVNTIQIQRGVGSSTNGAGAFGASMNIETNDMSTVPFGQISLAGGSFNTWKSSFRAGTGIIKNHWNFEGRASVMASDGYIDRASSNLRSYFLQGGYYDSKNLLKAVVFGGKEKTYQAWYGIDRETMEQDRTFNWAGAIFNDDGSIRYYDNQVDNYTQNHYQLHYSRMLGSDLNANISGHYTRGFGYYEEYRQDESPAEYGLPDTLATTDLIRRRWLDNHYYGITWSLHYKTSRTDFILGGAVNKYDNARHFGEIIWLENAYGIPKDYPYYENISEKNDLNIYGKIAWNLIENVTLYGDLQYRTISYEVEGIESHLNSLSINEKFRFINPKIGITHRLNLGTVYASYGIAHREPIRDDFTDALPGEKPKPELLGNLELGIRKSGDRFRYGFNYFLMNYKDQLVLTGAINDDGQYIRRNTGRSYRTGVELNTAYRFPEIIELAANLSLSDSRNDYTYDSEGEIITLKNTPISFSPSVIGSFSARITPVKDLSFNWSLKYVGMQYLDNTGNEDLTLAPYLFSNLRTAYIFGDAKFPKTEVFILVNNLFNAEYESNGAVYDGIPYYYPQAGINFLAGINLKF